MRAILLNICMVAAATALFRLLVPENGFKKQISFLISCFFITAVISFISNAEQNFKELEPSINFESNSSFIDFSGQTTAERKRAIAEEMSERVRAVLLQNGIEPSKIYIIVNISDTYSISINEIRLVLKPEDDFTQASALVEKEVGPDIKVIFEV
ncbi:MAG: stage III sporulation protein AF [Oscillospiraceae bacterium]|nr:stage III sporulation protein AF [Oscillospiraceae bacterium]